MIQAQKFNFVLKNNEFLKFDIFLSLASDCCSNYSRQKEETRECEHCEQCAERPHPKEDRAVLNFARLIGEIDALEKCKDSRRAKDRGENEAWDQRSGHAATQPKAGAECRTSRYRRACERSTFPSRTV